METSRVERRFVVCFGLGADCDRHQDAIPGVALAQRWRRVWPIKSLPIRTRPLSLDWARAKQSSSGGNDRLGSISKQGDRCLRSLFTAGALAMIRYAKIHGTDHRP
ncbi:transposase [Bradyrhizobium sp. McL0616]|uniref:transposase n=1 Tax=Bradyrhizobium sp. McL0616 TaxID=3415674 RepID=UPI003CFABB8E